MPNRRTIAPEVIVMQAPLASNMSLKGTAFEICNTTILGISWISWDSSSTCQVVRESLLKQFLHAACLRCVSSLSHFS
jgi:hypothetical protein